MEGLEEGRVEEGGGGGRFNIIYTFLNPSNGFSIPPPHIHLSLCLGGDPVGRRWEGDMAVPTVNEFSNLRIEYNCL